jgi:hypothetical protein
MRSLRAHQRASLRRGRRPSIYLTVEKPCAS